MYFFISVYLFVNYETYHTNSGRMACYYNCSTRDFFLFFSPLFLACRMSNLLMNKPHLDFLTTNCLPSEKYRIIHGEGLIVTDEVGKQYVDLSSATLNMALGHRYPAITKAVSNQMDKVWFVSTNFQNPAFYELGKLLVEVAPYGISAVNLRLCNGADAVDNAIKMARLYTMRKKLLCMHGGWHGESSSTLPLCSFNTYHRISCQTDVYYSNDFTLESLINLIKANRDAAAVLLDPIGTSIGLFDPSTVQQCLQKIRDVCTEYNIILVFDEIQTFGGYMGDTLFASGYYGVVPDIICIGKALGAGIAQSATLCRNFLRGVVCKKEGEYTHGGQPLGCIAAIEAVKSFLAISDTVSVNLAAFTEGVKNLRDAFPMIQFRQIGFFVGITPKEGCIVNWAKRIHFLGLEQGLLVRYNHGMCILLKPPVIITPEMSKTSLKTLGNVFSIACKEAMQPSVFYDDLLASGLSMTALTRIRKKPPVLEEQDEVRALLAAIKPSLSIKVLDVKEEVQFVQQLRRNGISALEVVASSEGYVEYLYQSGIQMDKFIINQTDPSPINSVVLQHQRFVEMAHDAGFSIANRTPSNALVSGVANGLFLVNFEFAYFDSCGDKDLLFAFEEVFSILQCLTVVKSVSVQEDLANRLCYAVLERQRLLAFSVWEVLSKFYSSTVPGYKKTTIEIMAKIFYALRKSETIV